MLITMPLEIFTKEKDFPLHLQYGTHNADDCYIHGHADFSELVVVLEGTAIHIAGEERYPISKGDVFVVSKYTAHGFTEAENIKICNIMFRPEEIFENIYNLRLTAGFQALFVVEPQQLQSGRFESRMRLSSHDFAKADECICTMMKEYTERREGWQTMVYSGFLSMCTELSRSYEKCCSVSMGGAMKLAKAVAYIERNFSQDISIAGLSKIAGYSERQLTRLFTETFSETPVEYITRLRIRRASHLLRNTSEPVGEIAWQCGFPDQNYFSRVFKKQTGHAPSLYRKIR
ncbi:MAG: helix-turn-helix domain-containing protein [Oscillospiraceae bacterium]|nr:helix-turn-helix domain-containing protein [Oscillospiraceae bacterium]